jgi:hypothetical protein
MMSVRGPAEFPREQPPLPKVGYSAAYLPSNNFKIVPLIVAYAKEESCLSGSW